MQTKKLYTCEICHTDYADKERAIECEKNHKKLSDCEITGIYKSLKSITDGMPVKIAVKNKNGKEVIYTR